MVQMQCRDLGLRGIIGLRIGGWYTTHPIRSKKRPSHNEDKSQTARKKQKEKATKLTYTPLNPPRKPSRNLRAGRLSPKVLDARHNLTSRKPNQFYFRMLAIVLVGICGLHVRRYSKIKERCMKERCIKGTSLPRFLKQAHVARAASEVGRGRMIE